MKPISLLAAFSKIEWAKSCINNVNFVVQHFIEGDNYESISRIDPTGQEEVYSFRLKQAVPGELAHLVGDALHNIRSPLDQMIAAVSIEYRGTAEGVSFPFGRHVNYFHRALKRQKTLLPADAIALIEESKPYKGGNLLLWAAHELNRSDKHYNELVPILVNKRWKAEALAVFKEGDGRAYVLGDPRGQHLVVNNYQPLPRGPSPEGEIEYLTVKPGTKFHIRAKPEFNISFGKIEGLERQPIVGVLNQMRDLIEGILLTFERRFFTS